MKDKETEKTVELTEGRVSGTYPLFVRPSSIMAAEELMNKWGLNRSRALIGGYWICVVDRLDEIRKIMDGTKGKTKETKPQTKGEKELAPAQEEYGIDAITGEVTGPLDPAWLRDQVQ